MASKSKCRHTWIATYEQEGGCKENPGVWSVSGNRLVITDHCAKCALRRRRMVHGTSARKDPRDTVEYEQGEGEES